MEIQPTHTNNGFTHVALIAHSVILGALEPDETMEYARNKRVRSMHTEARTYEATHLRQQEVRAAGWALEPPTHVQEVAPLVPQPKLSLSPERPGDHAGLDELLQQPHPL